MNKNTLALIALGSLSMMSFSPNKSHLYQVISSHPHDVNEINAHTDTVYQNGRLWIVEVKKGAPKLLFKYLRNLRGTERSYSYTEKNLSQKSEHVAKYLQEMSELNIKQDVQKLSEYKTRAAGTSGNIQAVNDLKLRFKTMGYEVEEICYKENACSIIAEKKGSSKQAGVILTMAHVDSVGKDYAGADDNGSGVAVLLEMARVVKDYDNHKTLRFFISNGEEKGLLGATHYARFLEKGNRISQLDLVINMDMVGYNSNGVVELETNPNQKKLAERFSELAQMYTDLKSKITLGAWGSDHVPFLDRGAPAILTIENWDTKTPCYHLACDTPEMLNYGYATSIGKLNLAALLHEDKGP